MKNYIIALSFFAALLTAVPAGAQNRLNGSADSILGEFMIYNQGNDTKVKFSKNADGTYDCTILWLDKPAVDKKTGKSMVGLKLIEGLKYNPEKKNWGGTKIYDPSRGIKANVTIRFEDDGNIALRGSVLGIGETVIWTREK